jgi:alkyl hydroperoxide reductase subunit F
MLDANIKTQLKAYLEKLVAPIELVASLDDSAKSAEMRGLLEDIASLSRQGLPAGKRRRRAQAVVHRRQGRRAGAHRFAGLPMGHEFTSLILALLQASGYAPKISDDWSSRSSR